MAPGSSIRSPTAFSVTRPDGTGEGTIVDVATGGSCVASGVETGVGVMSGDAVSLQATLSHPASPMATSQLRIVELLRIDTQVPEDSPQRSWRQVSAAPVGNGRTSSRRRVDPDFVVSASPPVEFTTQAPKLAG